MNFNIKPEKVLGNCRSISGPEYIAEARWYSASELEDGLSYSVEKGSLKEIEFIWFDLYVKSPYMPKHAFFLNLITEQGRKLSYSYGIIPCVSARYRIPLSAENNHVMWLEREGALIKPSVRGERIRREDVVRIEIRVNRIGKEIAPYQWCQTPLYLSIEKPELLKNPILPNGPLIDQFGQSIFHDMPQRIKNESQLKGLLEDQLHSSREIEPPAEYSPWGGSKQRRITPSGFFRTHYDGKRWWLVDPDGYLFWSSGIDCVTGPPAAFTENLESAYSWLPDKEGIFREAWNRGPAAEQQGINFLTANFIRIFGDEWKPAWDKITVSQFKSAGFNTFGNWSEWQLAEKEQIPYVRQLNFHFKKTPKIFRDFPDVFHPEFEAECFSMTEQLSQTKDSKAMIGYFLQNEAEWAFTEELPAAAMLFTTNTCHCRMELAGTLRNKYGTDEEFSRKWNMDVSFKAVEGQGPWSQQLSNEALQDLELFSVVMADRLYGTVSTACRSIDCNHLNLGTRFPGEPKPWMLKAMIHVDVLSINCYKRKLPPSFKNLTEICQKPILIGEWHFGGLDSGLPGLANQTLKTQKERGDAFRVYHEWAASLPYCIGTHYFRYYDNPPLGRPDGENYNIGFMNICNVPYAPIMEASRRCHEIIYEVVEGIRLPFQEEPDYLGI